MVTWCAYGYCKRTFLSIIWIVIAFCACFFPPIALCGQCKMLMIFTKSTERWANARNDKTQTKLCFSQMNDRLHKRCIQTNDKIDDKHWNTRKPNEMMRPRIFWLMLLYWLVFAGIYDSCALCSFDLMS